MIASLLFNLLPQSEESLCNICFSRNIIKETYTYTKENRSLFKIKKDKLLFTVCLDCEYCFCPENYTDNNKNLPKPISSMGLKVPRIGDGVSPGREYFMAVHAVGLLGKEGIKVLIFSPGASKDHILIRRNNFVAQCSITDIGNFQDSEDFIPIDTKEKFDIVVVCEVVEHFMKPRQEFSRLFSYLNKDGLLIISTNIRQDTDLGSTTYPFLTGHTSYYSGTSLIHIAEMNHLYVDFRTPTGEWLLSTSKRYIYFTKSKTTYFSIANYYSRYSKPNSEYLDATNNPVLTINDQTDSKNIRTIL